MRVDSTMTTNEARGGTAIYRPYTGVGTESGRHVLSAAAPASTTSFSPPSRPPLFGLSCPFVHDKYSEGQKVVLDGFVKVQEAIAHDCICPAAQLKQRHFQKTLQDVGNKRPPHSVVLCSSPPFFMSSEHPTMAATRKGRRAKGGEEGWREALFLLLIFSSRRPRLSSLVLKFSPCAGSGVLGFSACLCSTPTSRGMEPTCMSSTYQHDTTLDPFIFVDQKKWLKEMRYSKELQNC